MKSHPFFMTRASEGDPAGFAAALGFDVRKQVISVDDLPMGPTEASRLYQWMPRPQIGYAPVLAWIDEDGQAHALFIKPVTPMAQQLMDSVIAPPQLPYVARSKAAGVVQALESVAVKREGTALNEPAVLVIHPDDATGPATSYAVGIIEAGQIVKTLGSVEFHSGDPINGFNGVLTENLLHICLHRLKEFQAGLFPHASNAQAIQDIERALHHLSDRHQDHQAQQAATA